MITHFLSLQVQVSEGGPIYQVEPFLHTVVRIVRSPQGTVRETVAGQRGKQGMQDGAPGGSLLRTPTSLVLSHDAHALIVTDTGNAAVRRLDMATHALTTLKGNSTERIRKTWMHPGEGLAESMCTPGGSVSVVKVAKEAQWSTAIAPLPPPPENTLPHRLRHFSLAASVVTIRHFSLAASVGQSAKLNLIQP